MFCGHRTRRIINPPQVANLPYKTSVLPETFLHVMILISSHLPDTLFCSQFRYTHTIMTQGVRVIK